MALVKGTNSYVTVAEASAYFADSMHNTEWSALDATKQAQFLVSATRVVDSQAFVGSAVNTSQTLAFPRVGEYIDPRLNLVKSMNPTPQVVLDAVCEVALHLSRDTAVLNDEASFSRLTVGPITIEKPVGANAAPSVVRKLLKPFLESAGNVWWRAN